jgi:hypothetical protein
VRPSFLGAVTPASSWGTNRGYNTTPRATTDRDRQRRPQLALAGGLLLRLRFGGLALVATRPLFGLLGGIDGLLRALPLLGHRSLPWGGCHPARSLDHAWIMQ